MRCFPISLFCFYAMLFFASPAMADVLKLRNGDRLTGEIILLKDGILQFKTGYAGVVKVSVKELAGLNTENEMTLRYRSGGYNTGKLFTVYDGVVQIVGARSGVAIGEISEIYPGKEIPRGFQWGGRANLGAIQRSGNTDTRSLHINMAIVGRAEKNRLRFEGTLNKEFDESNRTADDFSVFVQHDRFVSNTLYFYTNVKLAGDDLQDLTLRTIVGTGGGWQIIESDKTNFSFEAGPSYVNENYETGMDRDFVAGRWAMNFDHYIWKRIIQFFHKHEGTLDLEDTGNLLVDSSTGLRFPLSDGFNLTLQADVEWDSDPEGSVSSTDKTYLLTAGYSW